MLETINRKMMKDFMLIFLGVDYSTMDLSPEEIQKRASSWMGWQAKKHSIFLGRHSPEGQ